MGIWRFFLLPLFATVIIFVVLKMINESQLLSFGAFIWIAMLLIGIGFFISLLIFIVYANLNRDPAKPLSLFGDFVFLFTVALAEMMFVSLMDSDIPQEKSTGYFFMTFTLLMVILKRTSKNKSLY